MKQMMKTEQQMYSKNHPPLILQEVFTIQMIKYVQS